MSDERLMSTPEDVIVGRVVPPEMLRDLLAVANIEEAACSLIAENLHGLRGMADSSALQQVILTQSGLAREQGDAVGRVLMNLTPGNVRRIFETIEAWVRGSKTRAEVFTPEILARLKSNLDVLIQDYQAIALMQKADRLLRDTGDEIENIKFVCDLRPVFDESRENVEAFVLVTTLRLVYLQQHGERQSCEIAFTEDELLQLKGQLDIALRKLEALKQLRTTLSVGNHSGDAI
ncbi:MAG: hypothetical protein KF851_15525 [Pirellulaceae bacterium]|nr:hypothetical protein [Pirellulaceae bacterium]